MASGHEPKSGSRRAQKIRAELSQRFGLSESTVSAALTAVVGAMLPRLPRHVGVALVSWLPETWVFLKSGSDSGRHAVEPKRGVAALKHLAVGAGIPAELATAFIGELFRFLAKNCGTPLVDAMRKRIPEIQLLEREAEALIAGSASAPPPPPI